MKRLSDFLDVFDSCSGLWCTIWYLGEEDDKPIWAGSLRDVPYWVATLKLPTRQEARKQGWDEVINFRDFSDKGDKNEGKSGLVIVVKD